MDRKGNWRELIDRWTWLSVALGAALFALRVSLEGTPPRPLLGTAAALLLLLAGLLFLYKNRMSQARKASLALEPLWLAWAYVVWPVASPTMALGIAFVALVALLVRNLALHRIPGVAVDGAVLLAALVLYVATLAPTVLPADSGEFQIVGPLLGVAHPPGFALFTVLAKLFSLLPFGEVAWRVNLMGAVTGALTLVVVSRTARRLAASPWAGIAAAGALGVSTTFWAQSTTVNIRALTMFFTALCCDFLVRFVRVPPDTGESVRALTGLAVSFGLLIAHHAWPAFFAPVFLLLILWHDPRLLRRFRVWPRYLIAFFAPFTVDLYIVIRAVTGAPFGTDALVDVRRIVDHLTGRGFGGDMFAFLRLDRVLWERFLVVDNILHFQFGATLLAIAGVGLAWMVWKQRKVAFLFGGVFAVMVFIVATYRAPQSVEYLMPAYIPVAIAVGYAVALPAHGASAHHARPPAPSERTRPGAFGASLVAVLLLPIFFLGRANLPSYLLLHRDRSAREYAESVLLSAPPDAHILSNWHWYTPLRYLQLVEGQRPDVDVTYIYPQGATTMPYAWPQRIAHELETSDRPLIVTNHYPTYADLPQRLVPHGGAFLVQDQASTTVPTDIMPVDADLSAAWSAAQGKQIRLLGYRLSHPEQVAPGDWITVDLIWQPLVRLERGYSFFVQLIGADGVPLGQRDRRHDAAPTYAPGEVLIDRYRFPVFLTAAPGEYRLIAGAYWTEQDGSWQRLTLPDGSDALVLSTVAVGPAGLPPVTLRPQYVPFVAGPALTGIDCDDTLPERRVTLHWQASPHPAVVELWSGGQLLAQATVPPVEDEGYVSTALDVPPGTRDLDLALRAPDGAALSRRGAWGLHSAAPLPLSLSRGRQHYLPFGGKLALTGVSAGGVWRAGETERVALAFVGLRPIVLDYVVSVNVQGVRATDGPSDGVPAIGAMPTFKWVRGSRIQDVHLLPVRAGASGQGQLTVGLYDAFTSQSLPPLDERIARLGLPAVPLLDITIP